MISLADAERLRGTAAAFLKLAREHDASDLKAVVTLDGERVVVEVERRLFNEDPHEQREETVTIKTGPQSRPKIVLAAPAVWIERA